VQVEAEHGVAYGKPLTRVRETVEVIRRLLQEGRVSYQGETVQIQSFDLWFTPRHSTIYVPRSQPDRITVNARCLDDVDGPSPKPTRFFDGRHWEEAQRRRIAEGGHIAAAGLNGAVTLKTILDR
jgi:hypothetical protein